MNAAELLRLFGKVASFAAPEAPGPAAFALRGASVALELAARFAEGGHNPAVEITRIMATDELLNRIHDSWQNGMDEKFGPKEK
jgi:hypothetical protein